MEFSNVATMNHSLWLAQESHDNNWANRWWQNCQMTERTITTTMHVQLSPVIWVGQMAVSFYWDFILKGCYFLWYRMKTIGMCHTMCVVVDFLNISYLNLLFVLLMLNLENLEPNLKSRIGRFLRRNIDNNNNIMPI